MSFFDASSRAGDTEILAPVSDRLLSRDRQVGLSRGSFPSANDVLDEIGLVIATALTAALGIHVVLMNLGWN
jgi:hypothetical protein